MKTIIIAIAAAATMGCVQLKTRISVNTHTGEVSWSSPKNVHIGSMSVVVDTNGLRTITLSNVETRNDPEVVKSAGEANAAMINSAGELGINAFKQGLSAAVKP